MRVFKSIIAAAVLSIAAFSANAIDISHTLNVTNGSTQVLNLTATYSGLNNADVAELDARGNKFVKLVQSYRKTNKGNYTVTFNDSVNGVVSPDEIAITNLTHREVNSILRANQRYANDVITASEVKELKGKKPWGNSK